MKAPEARVVPDTGHFDLTVDVLVAGAGGCGLVAGLAAARGSAETLVLEKLARPCEILVSEAVQRVARAEHRLRFEGERQLSGREEPVHVYSVDPEHGARAPGVQRPGA